MTSSSAPAISITAADLAERLAHGAPLTVLDVRDDAAWGIEAPGATTRHLPARAVLNDPSAAASGLDGAVAVVCNRGLAAKGVTQALRAEGVDAMLVEGGMRGWIGTLQTRPVDLGLDGLSVLQVQRPGRGCLSYVIASGGQALVVDPAPDAGFYTALAAEIGATVSDVVDTHLHADHLSGTRALAAQSGARLRLPALALERGVAYTVSPLHDGDTIQIGAVAVRALALPGHTTDMTGLLIGERALVTGDSLFADGIARPDLQQGDPAGAREMGRTLHATLHDRVLTLSDDTILLPGHTHPGVNADAITARLAAVRAAVPELQIDDAAEFAEALLAEMPPRPANYETVIAANAGTHPFDPELETGGNSCSTR